LLQARLLLVVNLAFLHNNLLVSLVWMLRSLKVSLPVRQHN
jgi:hypothetical protein